MARTGRRLTPGDICTFFSLGVGGVSTKFIHDHQFGYLFVGLAIWLAFFAFIHLRSRSAGGNFLEQDTRLYYGFGIACYLLGLLMACFAYLVYV